MASARVIGGLSGKLNTLVKTNGYKRWKTPLYPLYAVTATLEAGAKNVYKGGKYLKTEGVKNIEEAGNTIR